MRSYVDIRLSVAAPAIPYPARKNFTIYHGYNAGKVITPGDGTNFASADDARLAGATVVEPQFDEDGFKAAKVVYAEYERKVADLFYSELRAEYPEVNDDVFSLCYGMAYDRGHSSGMNEIANMMGEIVEFAVKIIAANCAA